MLEPLNNDAMRRKFCGTETAAVSAGGASFLIDLMSSCTFSVFWSIPLQAFEKFKAPCVSVTSVANSWQHREQLRPASGFATLWAKLRASTYHACRCCPRLQFVIFGKWTCKSGGFTSSSRWWASWGAFQFMQKPSWQALPPLWAFPQVRHQSLPTSTWETESFKHVWLCEYKTQVSLAVSPDFHGRTDGCASNAWDVYKKTFPCEVRNDQRMVQNLHGLGSSCLSNSWL